MLYRRTSELAIRALLYLALQPPGRLSPVHRIAEATHLPAPYLSKITRRLIRAGLIRAFRGPGGGLELGRPPESITLLSVVRAVDGSAQLESCVLGLQACSAENPCPMHARWEPLRVEIQHVLEETTLAILAEQLRNTMTLDLRWSPGASSFADSSPRRR